MTKGFWGSCCYPPRMARGSMRSGASLGHTRMPFPMLVFSMSSTSTRVICPSGWESLCIRRWCQWPQKTCGTAVALITSRSSIRVQGRSIRNSAPPQREPADRRDEDGTEEYEEWPEGGNDLPPFGVLMMDDDVDTAG